MLIRHGEAGRQGLLWPSRPSWRFPKVLDRHALSRGLAMTSLEKTSKLQEYLKQQNLKNTRIFCRDVSEVLLFYPLRTLGAFACYLKPFKYILILFQGRGASLKKRENKISEKKPLLHLSDFKKPGRQAVTRYPW